MLDEPDSGLDIDAVRMVAEGVNSLRGPEMGILLVTHYQRILNYVKPDYVHVMMDGRIVQSGGPELALELEAKGYDWLRRPIWMPGRRLRTSARRRDMTTPSAVEPRPQWHR